jgi:flagellar hook assembly protein FlgD
MASIVSVNSAATSAASGQIVAGNNQLDESDFLMLLVTELMNQDPLDPLTDRDFIAQMAQLNTLSETERLNENMQTVQMLQAAGLVGRGIEAIGPMGRRVSGIATEIRFIDSTPQIVIDNSTIVTLEDVVCIV